MNICIIPARSGSSRVKNKNLFKIKNISILEKCIKNAKLSKVFDEIIVNSDSQKYLKLAKKYNCTIYKRSKRLSGKNIYLIDVIKDTIKKLKFNNDINLGIMLTTSILTKPKHIIKAYKLYKSKKFKYPVISISEYDTPIQLAQYEDKKRRLNPYFKKDYKLSTRSTDHKKSYRFNESIVLNTVKKFKSQKNLIGFKPLGYKMNITETFIFDYNYQKKIIKKLISS